MPENKKSKNKNLVDENARSRGVLIKEILEHYSDENHALGVTEICNILNESGVEVSRTTVMRELQLLMNTDRSISKRSGRGGKYYIADRMFELPEVTLLMDAVSSAKFITPKKTETLLKKLEGLASVYQAEELRGNITAGNTDVQKCDNEKIYIWIDKINRAIKSGNKISVRYERHELDPIKLDLENVKRMTVSPYALIWNSDKYYLVCNHQKYDNLMHLRIDRIKDISPQPDKARPVETVEGGKDFDPRVYAQRVFNMYSGKVEKVEILFHIDILEQVYDRFGRGVEMKAVGREHVTFSENLAVSEGLVSYILQFGEKMVVKSPPELAEMVKRRAQNVVDCYSNVGVTLNGQEEAE